MANDDAQTDLKKRARRRLVGAAALALFAVIVLPMIMDPEPKAVGEDIEVRIPPVSGVNVAERSIEPSGAPRTVEVPPSVEVAPKLAPPITQPASADKPVEVAPKAEPPAKAPVVPASDAPKVTEPAKPVSKEAERVAAILSGEPATPAAAQNQFIVQIGAFSNAASASALADKIRQAGFEAFTQKIGSTTRVRVGPFASRDAAEKEASRLSGKGYKGVVMPRG